MQPNTCKIHKWNTIYAYKLMNNWIWISRHEEDQNGQQAIKLASDIATYWIKNTIVSEGMKTLPDKMLGANSLYMALHNSDVRQKKLLSDKLHISPDKKVQSMKMLMSLPGRAEMICPDHDTIWYAIWCTLYDMFRNTFAILSWEAEARDPGLQSEAPDSTYYNCLSSNDVQWLQQWRPPQSVQMQCVCDEFTCVIGGGGWGCEVSCGGPRGKTTTGSALDGAVFDIAQILAYLVHNMSRSQLYLGFGHFGWFPSFFGQ